eukprot:scaffold27676_cov126-Isochrysis_galbana.AAC.5
MGILAYRRRLDWPIGRCYVLCSGIVVVVVALYVMQSCGAGRCHPSNQRTLRRREAGEMTGSSGRWRWCYGAGGCGNGWRAKHQTR